MDATKSEILQFAMEKDIKFIRLAFCDIFGEQKNVSIMPNELPRAFESGISFDASAVKGFLNTEQSDLFLYPDPRTLSVLPWRPTQGRVVRLFCDIRHPDGASFIGDSRAILKSVVQQAEAIGLTCKIGPECEFYLFELDEMGDPTKIPHDQAGYCDIAPRDKGENVRREICLALEEMGIKPVSSHHEQGPGQNEIDYQYSDALEAADNFITFKAAVKTIALRNGLYASFMPKPLNNFSGNGLHVNLSLTRDGMNIFRNEADEQSPEAESFIAGVLRRVREITAFLNPTTNSYARFGQCQAPKYVSWSHQNRSQLIRIPAASGDQVRMELRSPDPACNPYLAFALLISAGLEGIQDGLHLCSPCNYNLYDNPTVAANMDTLPMTLGEAITLAENSEFVRQVLPTRALTQYLNAKSNEFSEYLETPDISKWEFFRYF